MPARPLGRPPASSGIGTDRHRAAASAAPASSSTTSRCFAIACCRWCTTGRPSCELLEPRTPEERRRFYEQRWDTWRWRLLFRLFFSRTVMGRLGRDPEFFRYVEGDVAASILARTRHALTVLDPADNPVRALDPHRHARRRAAMCASRRALRDHPRQPRPARMALPVARGFPRAIATGARSIDSI